MNPTANRSTPATQPIRRTILNRLAAGITGLVILFYWYYIDTYSVNFPFQDDNSLLLVIAEVKKNLGFRHNLHTFFRAENDHRIFLPRLVGYLDYLLTGSLHFKLYILMAALNMTLVLGLIYRIFRRLNLPFLYFLPIPFFLLQPQFHEVSLWALTGLQHTNLLLFLFTGLYLLEPSAGPGRIALAALLSLLAAFTHGNGPLIFVACGFFLLIQRRYRLLAVWIPLFLVSIGLYLTGYTPGSGVKHTINWAYVPGSFLAKVGAIFSAWGPFGISGSVVWGLVVCGILVPPMVITLIQSLRKERKPNLITDPVFAAFSFVLLTMGLITAFRSTDGIILENRFKIYAAVSAGLVYLYLLCKLAGARRHALLAGFSGLAIGFYFSSFYVYTPEVIYKQSRYAADTYNWRKQQTELCNESSIESSLHFLIPAYREGYWQVPDLFPNLDAPLADAYRTGRPEKVHFEIRRYVSNRTNAPLLEIGTPEVALRREGMHDDLFLVLREEASGRTYLAGTQPRPAGLRKLVLEAGLFTSGFTTVVPIDAMQPGAYRLGCLLKKGDNTYAFVVSDQTIRL
ncbi:hypothetical protein [Larkinella soli]|uniref:hypothetical protein n=1 Tax=Larkinella soli TaxID=1770527 RepID=UPI000FFC461A|nr:hypothetical protein [Larkinella soli]